MSTNCPCVMNLVFQTFEFFKNQNNFQNENKQNKFNYSLITMNGGAFSERRSVGPLKLEGVLDFKLC